MKTKQILRVAVVGCGSIVGNHIGGILSAGEKLVALCDILPAMAEAAKEKYALQEARLYTDWERMLDEEKPDVLHICTPHSLHAEMCIGALKRNIHVLCEKPVCISDAQLKRVEASLKKSKAQLAVCFQNRYEPNMQNLKRLADQYGVRGGYGTVIWNRGAEYYASGAWRGTKKMEGGGVMINQAIHTLDLLQWICGMPEKVTAHISNDHLQGTIEVEDTAMALFELPDGRKLNFFATTAGEKDYPVQLTVKLKSGETVLAQHNLFAVGGSHAEAAPQGPVVGGKLVWGVGHEYLIADFYRHIHKGEHFPIDFYEGASVLRMVLAMYRSKGKQTQI